MIFAIEIIPFQPLRDGQPSISKQWTETCPQGQVAVQNSLQERTEIKASGGKCEINIKISIATQQHLESTLDPLFCQFSSMI